MTMFNNLQNQKIRNQYNSNVFWSKKTKYEDDSVKVRKVWRYQKKKNQKHEIEGRTINAMCQKERKTKRQTMIKTLHRKFKKNPIKTDMS